MKKSLKEAIEKAKAHSQQYPCTICMVMDKKGRHAVVCASAWAYRERVLEGWHTVAKFLDGKEA